MKRHTHLYRQRHGYAVAIAALRLVTGQEIRTQTAVGRDLGVTRAAVSKAVKVMRVKLEVASK